MKEYHKIQTVYLRDPENKYKTLLDGQWAKPEFGYLADLEWEWTEKIDGTNIRVHWSDLADLVEFGGRTDNAQIPAFLINHLQEVFTTTAMRGCFDGTATLYGEGYGAKIQKGGDYRSDAAFILFDVYCGGVWLQRVDVVDVARKLGIPVVPIVAAGTLHEAVKFTEAGFTSIEARISRQAEGLVMRPATELQDRFGNRVIAKVKCKDFPS